jgi:hypothetical protein
LGALGDAGCERGETASAAAARNEDLFVGAVGMVEETEAAASLAASMAANRLAAPAPVQLCQNDSFYRMVVLVP